MTTMIPAELLMSKSAEGAVLGSMIIEPKCIPAVLGLVTMESFAFAEHRVLYEAIVSVWQRNPGGELDGVLLRNAMEGSRAMEDAGGLNYLQEVVDSVPTAVNAMYYARQVQERQRYRETAAAVEQMREALIEGGPVETIVQDIQGLALGLEYQPREVNVFHVRDHAKNVAVATQDVRIAIHTGFRAVDRLVAGFSPGDLAYIAARPSIGKTSFASCVALNIAKGGGSVVFISLEMTAKALMERMAAVLGQVPLSEILRQDPPQDKLDAFYAGAIELAGLPILIIENVGTVEQILTHVRRAKQTDKVDAVFIDYLGLMTPPEGQSIRSRNDQLTVISRGLKRMAQAEHIPVVALSQLNRAVEGRDGHRPRMSDLRDSGSLEQDADVVMLLHREDYYRRLANPQTTEIDGKAEVIVAKSRNGPTGAAGLVFIEEEMRFTNLAMVEEPC